MKGSNNPYKGPAIRRKVGELSIETAQGIVEGQVSKVLHANRSDLGDIRKQLRQFAAERRWNKFHSPKNLSMALVVEAAELAEHFQWLSPAASTRLGKRARVQVAEEMADVLLYLIRLADKLDVNLVEAAKRKIQLNATKYPVNKVRGSAKKYSEY